MKLCGIGAGVVAGTLAAYLLGRQSARIAASKPETTVRSLGISKVKTFFWGSDAFEMSALPPCFAFGTVTTAAAIALTTPSGPLASLELARGPVLASLLWIWGFFNCIGSQLKAKMGGGDEQAQKIGERSLMNTLEQGVPFLSLLWMTAGCVDAALATSLGVLYASLRMFYPLAYSFYGGFAMPCEMITMPNYMVLHVYAVALLVFGLGGGSLFSLPYLGQRFVMWCPAIFVGNLLCMLVGWDNPVGAAAGAANIAWNGPAVPCKA